MEAPGEEAEAEVKVRGKVKEEKEGRTEREGGKDAIGHEEGHLTDMTAATTSG